MAAVEGIPRWAGIQHIALVTRDLDATVRFYHGLLGMRLVAAMGPMNIPGAVVHGPNVLFAAGSGTVVHIFQQENAQVFTPPNGYRDGMPFVPGAFQHVAFAVPQEQDLYDLQSRLRQAGVETTEVMDQGSLMRNMLFFDNNGTMLEAVWLKIPGSLADMPGDYTNADLFGDPDPVSAVREIMTGGTAAH